MNRILLNADIGERGADHPVDRELMRRLDIANIACGGHAGDERSIAAFLELARRYGTQAAAHLSYPDRENFGRVSLRMPAGKLCESLDEQLAAMPGANLVKFHGGLYNDSCADEALAGQLARWLLARKIPRVITMPGGCLEKACSSAGIIVMREAFAERRYTADASGRLALMSRSVTGAVIEELDLAVAQAKSIIHERMLTACVEGDVQPPESRLFPINVETICVHSDSPIALELAQAIAEILGRSLAEGAV